MCGGTNHGQAVSAVHARCCGLELVPPTVGLFGAAWVRGALDLFFLA